MIEREEIKTKESVKFIRRCIPGVLGAIFMAAVDWRFGCFLYYFAVKAPNTDMDTKYGKIGGLLALRSMGV